MSPSAVVAIVVPIGMSVAKQFGLIRRLWCTPASASGLAYALPMSTRAGGTGVFIGISPHEGSAASCVHDGDCFRLTLLLTAKFGGRSWEFTSGVRGNSGFG
jgi:hypothetical protein